MKLLRSITVVAVVLAFCSLVYAYQRVADWGYQPETSNDKAEFAWSRLSYTPNISGYGYGRFGYGRGGTWQRDYPKADRQFLIALKR